MKIMDGLKTIGSAVIAPFIAVGRGFGRMIHWIGERMGLTKKVADVAEPLLKKEGEVKQRPASERIESGERVTIKERQEALTPPESPRKEFTFPEGEKPGATVKELGEELGKKLSPRPEEGEKKE